MHVETSSLQSKSIGVIHIKELLLKLINKASQGSPLNQKEYNFIFEIVKLNPNILIEIGFNHEDIYDLIEKDEYLAINILLNIFKCKNYDYYVKYFIKKILYKQRIEFPSIFIIAYLKKLYKTLKKNLFIFRKREWEKKLLPSF